MVTGSDYELRRMEEGTLERTGREWMTGVSTRVGFSTFVRPATLQKLWAEFIGTYLIAFIGRATITLHEDKSEVSYPQICVALSLIANIIIFLKHITYHFNPAVTITYAIFGQFPMKQVPLYTCAQTLGCILANGTLVLFEVTPEVCDDNQAFIMEIIISFSFVFFIFGTTFHGHQRVHNFFAGAIIVMIILVNTLVPRTKCEVSMNLGNDTREALSWRWSVYGELRTYMIAPTLGCILGGIAYKSVKHLDQLQV